MQVLQITYISKTSTVNSFYRLNINDVCFNKLSLLSLEASGNLYFRVIQNTYLLTSYYR
jgi:hypothetical protein